MTGRWHGAGPSQTLGRVLAHEQPGRALVLGEVWAQLRWEEQGLRGGPG